MNYNCSDGKMKGKSPVCVAQQMCMIILNKDYITWQNLLMGSFLTLVNIVKVVLSIYESNLATSEQAY